MKEAYSSVMENYASAALSARFETREAFQPGLTVLPSQRGEICKIICSGGRAVIRAREDVLGALTDGLCSSPAGVPIRKPDLYADILRTLGLSADDYPLKPPLLPHS